MADELADFLKQREPQWAAEWETAKADAKVIGCKPERVQRFKARHKISHDRPLSVDAQQLLRDELEADQRAAKGEATALNARLKRLQELATPERLAAMQQALSNGADWISELTAREYLASGLEYAGLKRQVKVTSKLIKTLQALVPSAASYPLETRFNIQQAVLWGAILRLPMLNGEPPTTSRREFLNWCGFDLSHAHRDRTDGDRMSDMFRPDQMSIADARVGARLPQGVELNERRSTTPTNRWHANTTLMQVVMQANDSAERGQATPCRTVAA